ncbi:O-antigen ligase family protein [Nocardioides mangrovicus]|uniref:O-antigen ligase family protein n=1 Tax=Nocardioides mangrovicus TaxID=2478913 RepID=A0A3L8P2K9_9ACTN|nr:O-antigen ligase family protein [Nocardioides mangrovicus]RLV49291.1 O-antigen ligase family protein [Nocardioides mangrovicus]
MSAVRVERQGTAGVDRAATTTRPPLGDLLGTPPHVWLFLSFVVCNVFSGQFGLLGIPAPPDRPLLLFAVVMLLLDHRTRRLRLRFTHAVMAATVLWILWSWLSTGTLAESGQAFALADRVVVPFAMFVLGPLFFDTAASRMLLLKTLTLIGLYLGLTGIFEIAGPHALVWPRYISDPSLGLQPGRARGPFLASEPMGMAAALIMVTSGALVMLTRHRGWQLAAGVACAACAATSLLCLTRSVWLGAALSIVLCFAAVPLLRRWAPVAAIGVAAVVAALLALVPTLSSAISGRADNARSVYDRLLTDHAAVRIIEAKPIFGVGWGRFVDVVDQWVLQADTYPLTNTAIAVHNVFLSLAAETGVLGAVLWGTAMLTGPFAVVISRRARTREMQAWRLIAACGILVWIGPTLLSPNPYPFPNNLIWLFGGVAGVALLTRRTADAPDDLADAETAARGDD